MIEPVVSNTGPLLHLSEIAVERSLIIFDQLIISGQVKSELIRYNVFSKVEATMGHNLIVEVVTKTELDAQMAALSGFKLHQADLSVAALAEKLSPALVLTDDLELRKGLEAQGHLAVGSAGILIRAFKLGFLTREELQVSLANLFDGSTLYYSRGFRAYVQKLLDDLVK